MINFDNYTNETKIKQNKNWPYIPDHPYRIYGQFLFCLILDKNNNKNKDNSSFNHNMATINANKAVDLDVVNNNSIYNSNNDKGNS